MAPGLSSRPAPPASATTSHPSEARSQAMPRMPRFPLAAPSCPQATPRSPPTPVAHSGLRGSRAPSAAVFENAMLTCAWLGAGLGPCPRGSVHLPTGAVTHTVALLGSRCAGRRNIHRGFNTAGRSPPFGPCFLPGQTKVSNRPHLHGHCRGLRRAEAHTLAGGVGCVWGVGGVQVLRACAGPAEHAAKPTWLIALDSGLSI